MVQALVVHVVEVEVEVGVLVEGVEVVEVLVQVPVEVPVEP